MTQSKNQDAKTPRFMNLITDFAFKHIFGNDENKSILISMLNAVIRPEKEIVDIFHRDKENLHDDPNIKKIIFDLNCIDTEGRTIVVEMQNQVHDSFMDRSIYYTARAFGNQVLKGHTYCDIKEVYSIFFLNRKMEKISKPFTEMVLKDNDTNEVLYNKLSIIYLSLAELNKHAEECVNPIEMWMYVIKNADKLEEIPFKEKIEAMKELEEKAEIAQLCNEDFVAYERSRKAILDYNCAIYEAEVRGEKKGKEEGIEEGRAEGERNLFHKLAAHMRKNGLAPDLILQNLGLSRDEADKLGLDLG